MDSPRTRSSARLHQAGRLDSLPRKPEGGTEQRLTRSADNSAIHSLSQCAGTCLSSWVSFRLPLTSTLGARPGISIQVTSMDDQSVQVASIRPQCSFAPIPAA